LHRPHGHCVSHYPLHRPHHVPHGHCVSHCSLHRPHGHCVSHYCSLRRPHGHCVSLILSDTSNKRCGLDSRFPFCHSLESLVATWSRCLSRAACDSQLARLLRGFHWLTRSRAVELSKVKACICETSYKVKLVCRRNLRRVLKSLLLPRGAILHGL